MLAREAHDGRVEGAAEAALGRSDHEEMQLLLAVTRKKRRRAARGNAAGEIGEHALHALGVGTRGFGRLLGAAQLRRQFEKEIIELIELRGLRQIGFENADPIGKKVIRLFEEGQFDVATLFFSRFKSVISQIPTALQLIPAQIPVNENAPAVSGAQAAYEYEPGQDEILAELLPRNISVQIFRGLLENAASEQGARMSAMDSATRNAGDMIRKQTMQYNRSRQAMITKELIEIISGAEAL